MELSDYLSSRCTMINQRLDELIPEKDVPYNQLFQAARYALIGGGKRLRSLLALATAETFGAPAQKALSSSCALEMIHTYSLIHDDLPCMDDDDFRRGKPSLHKAFPEGHAVLTGDFLLTFAFEIVADDAGLDADQKVALIQTLASQSGGNGMIGGQIMDMEAEGQEIDLERLRTIHHYKSGAMITAAVECGAIIGRTTATERQTLREFSKNIGLAFQIMDDVIDVESSKEKHGKATSSDISRNKMTYVSLMGIEKSKQEAAHFLEKAMGQLKQLSVSSIVLQGLANKMVNRKI